MSAVPFRGQKRESDSLELELQWVVSHPTWDKTQDLYKSSLCSSPDHLSCPLGGLDSVTHMHAFEELLFPGFFMATHKSLSTMVLKSGLEFSSRYNYG